MLLSSDPASPFLASLWEEALLEVVKSDSPQKLQSLGNKVTDWAFLPPPLPPPSLTWTRDAILFFCLSPFTLRCLHHFVPKPTVASDGQVHWFAPESRATTKKTTLPLKILKMWALTQAPRNSTSRKHPRSHLLYPGPHESAR